MCAGMFMASKLEVMRMVGRNVVPSNVLLAGAHASCVAGETCAAV